MSNNFQKVLADLADAFRANRLGRRELEHRLLELIADELESQTMDRGTWLKAFTEAGGDKEKAKVRYIDLRLRRLKDEFATIELMLKRQSRQDGHRPQEATTKTPSQSAAKEIAPYGSTASGDSGAPKSWLQQWGPLLFIFVGIAVILSIWMVWRLQNPAASKTFDQQELSYSGYAETSEYAAPEYELPTVDAPEPMFPMNGPSFDCAAASIPVEFLICGDPELAARDFRMARTFEVLKRIRPAREVAELQRKQLSWLNRRNGCSTEQCVARSYDEWMSPGYADPKPESERPIAEPILEGRWKNYRTAIEQGWTSEPRLDGRWVIIRMGCGTGCTMNIVGDHETGQVYDLGIGGEEMQKLELKFDSSSNRLFAQWEDLEDDSCQRRSYEWTGANLEPTSPINITPRPAWGDCPAQG